MLTSEVKKIIEANRDREQAGLDLYNAIAGVISKSFEGKKLTGRIEGLVKKQLVDEVSTGSKSSGCASAGAMVSFSREYGSMKMSIWNIRGFNFDNRATFYFGKEYEADNYSLARFAVKNVRYGEAAQGRNAVRDEILADTAKLIDIAGKIDAINQKSAEVLALKESIRELPDGYSLMPGSASRD
jgi:hypothetical protein